MSIPGWAKLAYILSMVVMIDYLAAITFGSFPPEARLASATFFIMSMWIIMDWFHPQRYLKQYCMDGLIGLWSFYDKVDREQHVLSSLKEQARAVVRARGEVHRLEVGTRNYRALRTARKHLREQEENFAYLNIAAAKLAHFYDDRGIGRFLNLDAEQLVNL